jgi:hypothetical protein
MGQKKPPAGNRSSDGRSRKTVFVGEKANQDPRQQRFDESRQALLTGEGGR